MKLGHLKLRRAVPLPDDARAALDLQLGERVIAMGRTPDGGWVVATALALVHAAGRTPWTHVAHAQWYAEESVLAIDPVPGEGRAQRIPLADPGRVPETVHERVMASIVLSRRVGLSTGGSVRIVARRADQTSDTVWQVVAEPGTDLTAPGMRAAADAAVAERAAELGEAARARRRCAALTGLRSSRRTAAST